MLGGDTVDSLRERLSQVAGDSKELPVIISADKLTPHQSVVNVMEASRQLGLTKITFSTKVN